MVMHDRTAACRDRLLPLRRLFMLTFASNLLVLGLAMDSRRRLDGSLTLNMADLLHGLGGSLHIFALSWLALKIFLPKFVSCRRSLLLIQG